ncbi:hypothetical protein CDAR_380801 [Caerostris darwini]|uniref:LAGLIDADG homing endonuclease n=1 Tax=Caerostris darwini TaxID=1538125 RepID=A0AAV4QQN6_9ARAC|nr:hypothetical protein CDAR_380801 [Caerostris darwini]
MILELKHFPYFWLTTATTPIPKSGKDPTNSDSYRYISLLSKTAKYIILHRLNQFQNLTISFVKNNSDSVRTYQLLTVVDFRTAEFGCWMLQDAGFQNGEYTDAGFL